MIVGTFVFEDTSVHFAYGIEQVEGKLTSYVHISASEGGEHEDYKTTPESFAAAMHLALSNDGCFPDEPHYILEDDADTDTSKYIAGMWKLANQAQPKNRALRWIP